MTKEGDDVLTEKKGRELIVLTNGTLLWGERFERLKRLDPEKLKLQISLDGSNPQINDPIRGEGSFERIVEGIENAVSIGFIPTVTTAISARNLDDLEATVEFLPRLGVRNYHKLQKLMAMGVLPGTSIELIRRFPAYVFQVDYSQFAVDEEIASDIYVRLRG